MTVNREARAKQRLRSALDQVRHCMRTGGGEAYPSGQLEVAESELQKMLAAVEQGTVDRHSRSGLWRMITDSWPLKDALGSEIMTAEFEFERLLNLPRGS